MKTFLKLFRLLGAAERQGFGGYLIYHTAIENNFRRPELATNIERTVLRVWSIDLADSYPNLTLEEKSVLRCISKSNKPLSIADIKEKLSFSDYKVRKAVQSLEVSNNIEKSGSGPQTKYHLNFDSIEFVTKMQMFFNEWKKSIC